MPLRSTEPVIHAERLGAVKVWRDDVAEMVEIIEQVTSGQKLEFSTPGYTFDTIEDLKDYPGKRIEKLTIATETRNIVLVLSQDESFINAKDPDLLTRGAMSAVARVAARCRRPWAMRVLYSIGTATGITKFFYEVAPLALGGVGLLLILNADKFFTRVSETQDKFIIARATWPLWTALVLVMSAFPILAASSLKVGRTIIFAQTRREAPGFYTRKKDDLVITIASNVASLIAGGLIGYWINTVS